MYLLFVTKHKRVLTGVKSLNESKRFPQHQKCIYSPAGRVCSSPCTRMEAASRTRKGFFSPSPMMVFKHCAVSAGRELNIISQSAVAFPRFCVVRAALSAADKSSTL